MVTCYQKNEIKAIFQLCDYTKSSVSLCDIVTVTVLIYEINYGVQIFFTFAALMVQGWSVGLVKSERHRCNLVKYNIISEFDKKH